MYLLQTYEMLTGKWLFKPEEGPEWTKEEDHLAQMMELTGERFHPEDLARAHLRVKYLDEQGLCLPFVSKHTAGMLTSRVILSRHSAQTGAEDDSFHRESIGNAWDGPARQDT